jgi:acyl-CoA synthetase (AMP-forming)/AMP-acid ligase II
MGHSYRLAGFGRTPRLLPRLLPSLYRLQTFIQGVFPMLGLMQDHPLLISSLIEFAERHHGEGEVVSRRVEGDLHRYTYKDVARRARQVANALDALKLGFSDRVATLAWNGYRHLELYFGVSGSGRVLHTLNPRLHPEQIAWIVNHAEDSVLCFDMSFLPIIKAIHAHCPTVKHFVALCDADKLPADSGIPGLAKLRILDRRPVQRVPMAGVRRELGLQHVLHQRYHRQPEGGLYSHRSTLLHALAGALPDALSMSARDSVLPVVPMFHVNAWGLPYSAAMTGAKLVFPALRWTESRSTS